MFENPYRLAALIKLFPVSKARRIAVQTENWSDATFRELVAFKTIEAKEHEVLNILLTKAEAGYTTCVVGGILVHREDGWALEDWAAEVLRVMATMQCIDVTPDEVEEFYLRRECARALDPKGVSVVCGL